MPMENLFLRWMEMCFGLYPVSYTHLEMSEEAIRKEISEVLAGLGIEAPTGKDKGRIMKELMPRVKGKADGALVNKLVGEVIQ